MGVEKHKVGRRYGIADLGILEGPSLRGAETVVAMVEDIFDVAGAAFLVFDDFSATVLVRSQTSAIASPAALPTAGSIVSRVRHERATIVEPNLKIDAPEASELRHLSAQSIIACPVYGPDSEPAGALVAFDTQPRAWTAEESEKLENLAHLISQEIVLRASFETLRIMAEERKRHRS